MRLGEDSKKGRVQRQDPARYLGFQKSICALIFTKLGVSTDSGVVPVRHEDLVVGQHRRCVDNVKDVNPDVRARPAEPQNLRDAEINLVGANRDILPVK